MVKLSSNERATIKILTISAIIFLTSFLYYLYGIAIANQETEIRINSLKALINSYPYEYRYYQELAGIYLSENQRDMAIKTLEQFEAQLSESLYKYSRMGKIMMSLGLFEEAEKYFLKARENYDSDLFFEELSDIYLIQKNYSSFVEELGREFKQNRENIFGIMEKMGSALKIMETQEALEAELKNKIQINKFPFLPLLILFEIIAKRPSEAINYFQIALQESILSYDDCKVLVSLLIQSLDSELFKKIIDSLVSYRYFNDNLPYIIELKFQYSRQLLKEKSYPKAKIALEELGKAIESSKYSWGDYLCRVKYFLAEAVFKGDGDANKALKLYDEVRICLEDTALGKSAQIKTINCYLSLNQLDNAKELIHQTLNNIKFKEFEDELIYKKLLIEAYLAENPSIDPFLEFSKNHINSLWTDDCLNLVMFIQSMKNSFTSERKEIILLFIQNASENKRSSLQILEKLKDKYVNHPINSQILRFETNLLTD